MKRTSKSDEKQGKPLPQYFKEDGYLYVMVTDENGEQNEYPVHVLVAETFLGLAPSPFHRVFHKNGILADNRETNLEWRLPV